MSKQATLFEKLREQVRYVQKLQLAKKTHGAQPENEEGEDKATPASGGVDPEQFLSLMDRVANLEANSTESQKKIKHLLSQDQKNSETAGQAVNKNEVTQLQGDIEKIKNGVKKQLGQLQAK